jgi:uncharacterized protein (DUF2235 family)
VSLFRFWNAVSSSPDARNAKHIFIGLDGTQNAAYRDTFATNVYRIGVALKELDCTGKRQLFFYYPGVGTQAANKYLSNLFSATGEGIELFILEAYINLVLNYTEGDKLYIFGFSRGAVAARALTGLISSSGLVKASSSWLIDDAWNNFINDDYDDNYQEKRKGNVWPNTKIDFLGIWDAVPGPYKRQQLTKRYRFKNFRMDQHVKNGVHIVSIDETRRDFLPLLWDIPHDDSAKPIQIWMPGVHSDIGGGYKKNTLANVSLLTMVDLFKSKVQDVEFDEQYLSDHVVSPIAQNGFVINNEWEHYRLPFARKVSRDLSEDSLFHPLILKMLNSSISMRGIEGAPYDPFQPRGLFRHGIDKLKTITFSDQSFWKKAFP